MTVCCPYQLVWRDFWTISRYQILEMAHPNSAIHSSVLHPSAIFEHQRNGLTSSSPPGCEVQDDCPFMMGKNKWDACYLLGMNKGNLDSICARIRVQHEHAFGRGREGKTQITHQTTMTPMNCVLICGTKCGHPWWVAMPNNCWGQDFQPWQEMILPFAAGFIRPQNKGRAIHLSHENTILLSIMMAV